MGNVKNSLMKFLKNKNTVTILAVLIGVLVIWYFYNKRIDDAISTLNVPYAIEKIDTASKIESDNIGYKELTKSSVKNSDIITNVNELTDMYVCTGTSVPANGFFYKSQLCESKELPNSVFDNIPDGYTIFSLTVNNQTTYANSIMPGDYIDLYMQAVDDDKNVIYGPLIESIEVLAVRDSSGRDVFWNSNAGDSAFLLFAVPNNYHKLLTLSSLISGYSIKLSPVPRSKSYTENPGETKISSSEMCSFLTRNLAEFSDMEGINCNE